MTAPSPPSTTVKVLVAGAMAVVGVGFAVLFFAQVKPPDDAPPPPRPARSAAAASLSPRGKLSVRREELCYVDANRDDVLDPVVWAADGDGRSRAVAVDGKTGRGLWASPALRGEPEAILVGEGCVSAQVRGGEARGLRVDTGEATACPSARQPGDGGSASAGVDPAPAPGGGLIHVVTGGALRAINTSTGKELWQATAPATLP